jgi:hypothetical protein
VGLGERRDQALSADDAVGLPRAEAIARLVLHVFMCGMNELE